MTLKGLKPSICVHINISASVYGEILNNDLCLVLIFQNPRPLTFFFLFREIQIIFINK